jgi:hypothetical protein
MRPILCVVILACCSISFAGDSLTESCKNALGWDNGLSYRHLIGKNTWLGLAVGGSITTSRGDASDSDLELDTLNDSVTSSSNEKPITDQRTYSITLTPILIGQVAQLGVFGIDYFVRPSYTYSWSKDSVFGKGVLYSYNYDNMSQTLGVAAGFAPTVTLFRRFCLETKFGISYAYTWSRNISYQYDSYSNVTDNLVDKSSSFTHTVSILGSPFSLSMSLSGHFYF